MSQLGEVDLPPKLSCLKVRLDLEINALLLLALLAAMLTVSGDAHICHCTFQLT